MEKPPLFFSPIMLLVWEDSLSVKEAAGELLVNCVYSELCVKETENIPEGLLTYWGPFTSITII